MHLDDDALAPIRARFGEPARFDWEGEVSELEYGVATYNPGRTHDVTLFIVKCRQQAASARRRALPGSAPGQSPAARPRRRQPELPGGAVSKDDRIALIRKHMFPPNAWRPPGGGVKPGEDFVEAVQREAFEETGLRVELERYLVDSHARFLHDKRVLDWRTHVFLARTDDEEIAVRDTEEIAEARWGTLEELAGPLRERLLATGRAFWRYRVELHDATLAALDRH